MRFYTAALISIIGATIIAPVSLVAQSNNLSTPGQPSIELLTETPAGESLSEAPSSEQPDLTVPDPLRSQGSLLDGIFGFAAEFGVTGGANKVYVTTKAELKAALREGGNHVIIDPSLAGNHITLNTGDDLVFGGNTTLDGAEAPGFKILLEPTSSSTAHKIHAIILNSGNSIVHRIHLVGNYVAGAPPGNSTSGIFSRTGAGYWIDHVTVSGMDDDAVAFGDDDDPNTSRMVTVSHTHIYDSNKGLMFVHNGVNPKGNPQGYTGAFNHIEGYISDRAPYIDGTQNVHWYNNYVHDTNRAAAIGKFHVGGNTTIALFENNYYANQLTNGRAFNNPTGTGRWAGISWLYHNDGNEITGQRVTGPNIVHAKSGEGPGSPVIPYSYDLLDASEVQSYVIANSGVSGGTTAQ